MRDDCSPACGLGVGVFSSQRQRKRVSGIGCEWREAVCGLNHCTVYGMKRPLVRPSGWAC